MRETEEFAAVKKVETALVCDCCGLRADRQDDWEEFQEFLCLRFTGGYGAILGDMCTYELDLCQHCVEGLLGPYLRPVDDGFLEEL